MKSKTTNTLEKSNDELREKCNDLLIQKDLLHNEVAKARATLDQERSLVGQQSARIAELEASVASACADLRDKETAYASELSKVRALLAASSTTTTTTTSTTNGCSGCRAASNEEVSVEQLMSALSEERAARQACDEKMA